MNTCTQVAVSLLIGLESQLMRYPAFKAGLSWPAKPLWCVSFLADSRPSQGDNDYEPSHFCRRKASVSEITAETSCTSRHLGSFEDYQGPTSAWACAKSSPQEKLSQLFTVIVHCPTPSCSVAQIKPQAGGQKSLASIEMLEDS